MMTINGMEVEALRGETILEAARRAGCDIPSLCHAKGMKHRASCMVCAVRDCDTGQIIPSCTTVPTEGMRIDATGDDVRTVRSLSLELLLSDHRADCEAPCSLVCPQGLDVERLLLFHDRDKPEEARRILVRAFALPAIACDTCKAPCEKACRRGTVDKPVAIRAIVRELAAAAPADTLQPGEETPAGADKKAYLSRLGRFRSDEKAYLQENAPSPSRCLHCACAGRKDCKLRLYATAEGIKRPRYEASSALPAMKKIHVGGNMWFEQAKCIRCGLCVYNSENGFTFSGRGFAMQVTLPEENKPNVSKTLASLCPTGAIYLS